MTGPDTPTGAGAEQAPAPTEVAPPRATWATNAPESPWCPPDWLPHLGVVAPGLRPPDATQAASGTLLEATGTRAASGPWSLLAASRRGKLHAHRGEHREDAAALLTFAGGWCAAVADGAGSAPWSRLGSAIATHVATHALREALHHGSASGTALAAAMHTAGTAANAAMRQFAELAGLALRDLRTTLLLATAHGAQLATMQVGDGGLALIAPDGTATAPHAGDSGEFSGEVTHFLPDDGAAERLAVSIAVRELAGWPVIVLATDGVEDPWYPFVRHAPTLVAQMRDGVTDATASAAGVTPGFRASVFDAPDPVHALMEWLAFEKRGENDDRTLFVAWASSPSV